jgi:hypothetical protein
VRRVFDPSRRIREVCRQFEPRSGASLDRASLNRHDPPRRVARDRGPGTLRDALDDRACGTITFDPALSGQAVDLTSVQLTIDREVSIEGRLPDVAPISADSQQGQLWPGRAFERSAQQTREAETQC